MVELFVYASIIALVTVLCFGIGWLAYGRRPTRGAVPLAGLALGAGIWALTTVGQLLTADYAMSIVWGRFTYLGVGLCVLSWIVLAIEYTGRERYLTPAVLGALAIEPVLVNVLVWVNPMEVFWRGIEPGSIYGFTASYGPAFWAHAAYAYLLQFVATLLFLGHVYRARELYREQSAAVVLGLLAPWTANLLWLAGVTAIDWTPVGFAVTGLAIFWAIQRRDFIDLTPVASRTVLERIPNGVVVIDSEDRLLETNRAFRRLVDGSAEELIGAHVKTILPDWPELHDAIATADSGESVQTFEVDTGHNHYEVDIDTLRSDPARSGDRLVLIHDITVRKRREQELERQNEQLDRFAQVITHDIRNPLNVASGYVDIAAETGDTEHLERVQSAHDRMDQLLENVGTLVKDGQTLGDTELLRLEAIAREAARNVDLGDTILEIDEIGTVDADRNRLLHIFENLFRNAVEHGTADDDCVPELTIRVGRLETTEGFYVEDTGPGIPPDRREQVFDHGHTTNEGGTGLGLTIVQNSVTAHGWEVTVKAEREGGARFEVTGVEFVDPSRSLHDYAQD